MSYDNNVEDYDDDDDDYDDENDDEYYYEEDCYLIDGVGFADEGGNSALRAATKSNPRNLPCPQCKSPNRLTPLDKQAGYRCDQCADNAENGRDEY